MSERGLFVCGGVGRLPGWRRHSLGAGTAETADFALQRDAVLQGAL